tara:strand:+ start:2956 stop:3219 length:264 start_codon:yes stop_codon:yes gene_type:complete
MLLPPKTLSWVMTYSQFVSLVDRRLDRPPSLLDGGEAILSARNLDEEIGACRTGVKFLGCGEGADRVMGQQGETSNDTQPSTPLVRP